jgi:MFS family permease
MEKTVNRSEKVPIPGNVYLLGLVSFFNDVASEMLYPILPIFITQILQAPVFVVGIIDGVAEGASSLFKTLFGYLSDKHQRRKPFIMAGYGSSALSKVIIALSTTWPLVFVGRFIDRLGKGIRTGARDALLLDAANESNKGLVFGIHRSIDSTGAVVGPLIALLLLREFDNNLRFILYVAAIPSFIGIVLFVFIKEARKPVQVAEQKASLSLSLKNLSPQFRFFLLAFALFSLGNSSDSFLILQSKQIGLSISAVVLVYVVYNVVYTFLSTPAGILADTWGARNVFLVGLLIYAGVYLGFAFNTAPAVVWVLFAIYGTYIALTDGVSKALIGSYIATEQAGAAYGATQTVTSLGTLLASVIGGFLWSAINPMATFLFGATCAFLSFVLFAVFPGEMPSVN